MHTFIVFSEAFLFCDRRHLTEEDIQAILFDCPSGSERFDLDNSDDDCVEALASQGSSNEYSSDSFDTVQESTTVKDNIKKTWHWIKKDLQLNEGFHTSEIIPRVTAAEVKTPLSMSTKLVDEDLIEHLMFETNR